MCVEEIGSSIASSEEALADVASTSNPSRPTPTTKQIQTNLGSAFTVPSKTELAKVTRALTNLLAVTGTPFNFVESEAFRKFMAIVSPHYKVPCRTTFSETHIPKLYTDTKEKIRLTMKDVLHIGLTTDGWTGCNGNQFISVTASYITDEWCFKTVTLACRELNASHTGEHIAAVIMDVLGEYGIDKSRISAVTTDRGSNMISAVVTHLQKPHTPCFAHVLNTFVQNILKHAFVAELMEKVRGIYNILSHSSAAKRDLKQHQSKWQLPLKKMPSSCATRWWSELDQLKFVVEQEKALYDLCNTFANGTHQALGISTIEVKKINVVLGMAVELQRVQEILGGETDVTCSLILPIIERMHKVLHDIGKSNFVLGVLTFKNDVFKFMDVFEKAYKPDGRDGHVRSSHIDMATFLDPRFESNNIELMEAIVRLDLQHAVSEEPTHPAPQQQPSPNSLQLFFGEMNEEMEVHAPNIDDDLGQFAKEPKASMLEQPLLWWKRNATRYTFLSKLARKYLCVTATSVPSERVFSVSGNVLTKERYSLSDEHVEQLVFLTKNKEFVEW